MEPDRLHRRSRRLSAYAVASIVFVTAPGAVLASLASRVSASSLPDPCQVIPAAHIGAAFRTATPPTGTLTTVLSTETCLYVYKGVSLSVFVGLNSIGSPGTARKASKVPNLPNGYYATFTDSKQTQVAFYKGDPATAVYGIVRSSNGTISKLRLQAIAKDLYASIPG